MSEKLRKTPLFSVFIFKKTILGADRKLAGCNAVLAYPMIQYLGVWSIFASLAMHLILVLATKKDSWGLDVFMKYRRQGDFYDPWPYATQERRNRPQGFCRNWQC